MKTILAGGLVVVACGLISCQSAETTIEQAAPLEIRFYLESKAGEPAAPVQLPISGVDLGGAPKAVFSEFDILKAKVVRLALGQCVIFKLTPAAARDLYHLSVPAQGRRLVVSLNGICLGVHCIEDAIEEGIIPVFLEVPDEQLADVVSQVNQASASRVPAAARTVQG